MRSYRKPAQEERIASDAPENTRSMQTALHDLDLSHLWVIYPGGDAYHVEKKISVLSLQKVPELIHQI